MDRRLRRVLLAAAMSTCAVAVQAQPRGPVIAGPPDWSAYKAHVDKAKAAAGTLWASEQTYFCMPGQVADTDHDPPIEPVRLFDNVWAVGDERTVDYVVITSDGPVLVDAGRAAKLESLMLPSLRKIGVDPASVKYVLVTQGFDDHFGGAQWFQQHGAHVAITSKDWDMMAKFPPALLKIEPKRDVEVVDGQPIVVGGLAFTPVSVPGQSADAVGYIFPVLDHGRMRMAALFGASILRGDRLPPKGVLIHVAGVEHWGQVADKAGVEVELQNHPMFDDMWKRAAQLKALAPGAPNPFVVGRDGYKRFITVMTQCLRAGVARRGEKAD